MSAVAPEAANSVAEMNITAAGQFTHGLRAFFLAIAVLAWFITWWGFILAALVGSFLPLIFVRRISATLGPAGLREEGEAQVKLALILGVSGAILWLTMCGWYLSQR